MTSNAHKVIEEGLSLGKRRQTVVEMENNFTTALAELLAVLHQEGPSTEGIFRRVASGTALRELREALDRGLDINMGGQPADLLAVVLKVSASDLQMQELLPGLAFSRAHLEPLSLQDFLRNIPSKLLVEDLYEEWMAAMEKTGTEETIKELKVWACGRAKWPCRQSRQGPSAGGSSSSSSRRGLPWPFALWLKPAAAQAPGQEGSGCSRALFGQPLAALCGEDDTLPQPIQELLAVLHQEGPSTEGIFCRAASRTALWELCEALDHGLDIDTGSQPADLLAVVLKVSTSDLQMQELLPGLAFSRAHLEPLSLQDFFRNIPSKLLVEDLYEEWMSAVEKTSTVEKIEEVKVFAGSAQDKEIRRNCKRRHADGDDSDNDIEKKRRKRNSVFGMEN
ncbi:hypothetical protein Q9233_005459 [Columba guinea]|nr:hypothetical protein Q9233_005459 [Columba guinea]